MSDQLSVICVTATTQKTIAPTSFDNQASIDDDRVTSSMAWGSHGVRHHTPSSHVRYVTCDSTLPTLPLNHPVAEYILVYIFYDSETKKTSK